MAKAVDLRDRLLLGLPEDAELRTEYDGPSGYVIYVTLDGESTRLTTETAVRRYLRLHRQQVAS